MIRLKKKLFSGLRIGNFKAKLPIIQGGMSVGISLSGLASAVANEGGIGVIGGAAIGMLEDDFNKNFREANTRALVKEIKKAREKSNGLIGVNLMVALSDYEDLLEVAVKNGVDVLFLGAGLPLRFPESIQPGKIKTALAPIISSARAAKIILESWARKFRKLPDALVVEGPKAGGHLGFKKEQIDHPDFQLEKILPAVIETIEPYQREFQVKIPVIAAGGIYSGADVHRFLALGADGVQMATRFVTTHECDASEKFKEAYLRARREDLVIINSPVGLPGRAINNSFLEDVSRGVRKPFKCSWKCLKTCQLKKAPYCIASALTNAKKGNLLEGFSFAGVNAYLSEKISSVREVIASLIEEYDRSLVENQLAFRPV
mgnify:FL=1|jgi:NAD(P)H-dependent flavin oxidoreductase YrpB (nitropropane dioxygenase family)